MASPQERLRRMNTLFSLIRKCKDGAVEIELIAQYCVVTGITEARVKEYIKLMINAKKIKREEERLFSL